MTLKEFPRWAYGPKGEAQIFNRVEDIPKGWQDHPSKFEKRKAKEESTEPETEAGDDDTGGLTRQQIIDDLTRRGIAAPPRASTASLYRKLQLAVDAAPAP